MESKVLKSEIDNVNLVLIKCPFELKCIKCKRLDTRLPCFCYEGLPLVAFWRFYCINLVFELISPLIDNTVQQATHMFIILLKTKKLKIVEDDIFNVFVLFTISNQPEFRDLNSQPLLDRETTKTNKKVAKL